MAVKGKIEDEPEGEDAEGEGKGKGKKPKVRGPAGPMTLVIVGAIALFVAVLGAQVAAPLLTKALAGDPNAPAEDAAAEDEEQLALAEELEEPVAEEEPAELREPAIYVPLDPPFVVSFNDESGDTRFLQLTLQAMARRRAHDRGGEDSRARDTQRIPVPDLRLQGRGPRDARRQGEAARGDARVSERDHGDQYR